MTLKTCVGVKYSRCPRIVSRHAAIVLDEPASKAEFAVNAGIIMAVHEGVYHVAHVLEERAGANAAYRVVVIASVRIAQEPVLFHGQSGRSGSIILIGLYTEECHLVDGIGIVVDAAPGALILGIHEHHPVEAVTVTTPAPVDVKKVLLVIAVDHE